MATVEDLVQKLGKPPREICLDWVWQIEHLPIASEIESDQARKLSMVDLEVDATGQLQLRDQESHHYSSQDLVEELKKWSVESSHENLGETNETSQEIVSFDNRSVASSLKRPILRKRGKDKLPMQIAVALIAVALVGFGFFAWTDSSHPVASHDSGNKSASNTKQVEDKSKQLTKQESQSLEDFSLQPHAANVASESLEVLKEPEPDVGLSDSTESTQNSLVDLGSKLPNVFASDPKNLTKQDTGVGKSPQDQSKDVAPGSDSKDANVQAMSERDVMKEVTDIAQDASKDATETDIKGTDDGSLPTEPIVIQNAPMVQVLKFGSQFPNRSRQSTWNLELMVDDGFVITPNEPQRLKERQTITWSIAMDDAESPMTRIVIAVDIPPRQTSLRWRIAATADDLPQLALPLDLKLLRAMQDRMRFFSLQADSVTESIKQSSNSLPREMRAIATKQRSDLENQSKLAKRLLTIASEASLINDQLHGHISVRVKLQEGEE